MDKLPEVEIAKALMTEAMSWSVMKWLREKKRVRKTADKANAALDELNAAVKADWAGEMKAAYQTVSLQSVDTQVTGQHKKLADAGNATLIAKKVREADDEAYRARMDAEKTFDEAERQLSTSLAREGCRKAIHGWELHEKAIRMAQSAAS